MCHTSRGTCCLSFAAITDPGLKVHLVKAGVGIMGLQGKVIGKGTWPDNIYELIAFTARADVSNNKLWHEKFSQLNLASLKEMYNSKMIVDIPKIADLLDVCEA